MTNIHKHLLLPVSLICFTLMLYQTTDARPIMPGQIDLPAGFAITEIVTGLNRPTDMALLPSGDILIAKITPITTGTVTASPTLTPSVTPTRLIIMPTFAPDSNQLIGVPATIMPVPTQTPLPALTPSATPTADTVTLPSDEDKRTTETINKIYLPLVTK